MTRRAINGRVPLIGFSGSPWTLACYMIEGGGSDDYAKVKSMMYSRPDLMHKILNITADAVTEYLNAQIIAGAQAVMIFDSWGGVLSEDAYKKFSLSYMRQIVEGLIKIKDGVVIPNIAFSKGGGLWLDDQAEIGVNALGVDWTVDLAKARALVGDRVTLQGNMDPVVLRSTPEAVAREAERVVRSFGPGNTGHVFNLGHGISQYTPPENVSVLIDTVHRVGREMRVAESQQLTLDL
jgi:uroporphyrinogen decarboxylase